jgi:RimJ/RimL family protein N-acetyltransferase
MLPDGPSPSEEKLEPLRLDLRPWQPDDLPLMQAIMGDPRMTEHLGGPESSEKLQSRLERYVRIGTAGNDRMYVIAIGSERIPCGSVGFWEKSWQGESVWEAGWHVLPAFQGRHIAAQATSMVVEQARSLGLHRFMHAFPSIHNAASNALCLKLGFALQGESDFEFPQGHWMRCNDWMLDLHPDQP